MTIKYDEAFLKKLSQLKVRIQYAKIIVLSFDEKPVQEIQGTITTGNLSVNGSSAIRRTINLTMTTMQENLENVNNIISINKKIKIFIGYENPFPEYEPIVWFPCGLYVISNATSTRSTSGLNISISGQDKMVMLNGSVGGMLPASVTFNETYIIERDGTISGVEPVTFHTMIREAVTHFGGEDVNKVFINDVGEQAKLLIRWVGDKPLYINENGLLTLEPRDDFTPYPSGSDVGYEETPFTWPGELTLSPGDSVVTLLDKIVGKLGNFEYFYDIDGNFIFQQKRNFLDIQSPLLELTINDYLKNYSNEKVIAVFDTLEDITQIQKNPKYSELKNDYIIWGTRKTSSGAEVDIRYHIAIDERPPLILASQYMWAIYQENILIRYAFTYTIDTPPEGCTVKDNLIAKPCEEWREELYRQALVAQITNGQYSYYDQELIAEWRKLFDTMNDDWEDGWNPNVNDRPHLLDYWLDFIEIPQYSVNSIGRRSFVTQNTDVKSVFNQRVPDIVFLTPEQAIDDRIAEYNRIGQIWCQIPEDTGEGREIWSGLVVSDTGVSAFDRARELLYQHLTYNTSITLNCLPRYNLEPNNLIYMQNKESGLNDKYVISQFNLPLTYNGTMSITATQALTRI